LQYSYINISFEVLEILFFRFFQILQLLKTFATLNFPEVELKTKQEGVGLFVFDGIRKKWLVLTPEEWVRQHLVNYLVTHKSFPPSLISLEAGLKYNALSKRSDVLVYNKLGKPMLIIECKAPEVAITQKVIEQVSVYNKTIGAAYLCVSNGLKHYCWTFNTILNKFDFLQKIPHFKEIEELNDSK